MINSEILTLVLTNYRIDQIAPAEPRNWIKGSSGRSNHGGFRNARPATTGSAKPRAGPHKCFARCQNSTPNVRFEYIDGPPPNSLSTSVLGIRSVHLLAQRLPRSNDAMHEHHLKRVIGMSITSETCQTSGLYLTSGACGHAGYQRITKGQSFPTCRACGKAVTWTFLRETYSPNSFGHPANQEAKI